MRLNLLSSRFLVVAAATALNAPISHAASLDENLAAYAAKVTRVVSQGREIHLWHWKDRTTVLLGKDANTPIAPTDDTRVYWYLRYLVEESFWKGNGGGAAGPGLYAAVDPAVTASYGGQRDWVLMQMKLKPGMKFLDALTDPGVPSELQNQSSALGCQFYSLSGLFNSAGSPKCRDLRNKLISISGASALRYSFSAAQFTNCSNRKSSAFVVWDENAYWNGAMAFVTQLPAQEDAHQEMRLILAGIFNRQNVTGSWAPWPSLKGQNPKATDLDGWMRANLMDCGGGFPEDR